jgi:hypothetical protein
LNYFSLLVYVGNFAKGRCGAALSRSEIAVKALENAKFPANPLLTGNFAKDAQEGEPSLTWRPASLVQILCARFVGGILDLPLLRQSSFERQGSLCCPQVKQKA